MPDLLAALEQVEQERDAARDAIQEYLEWGPMTGSDRDFFTGRFRKVLELRKARAALSTPEGR